jgi:hypothetical protein
VLRIRVAPNAKSDVCGKIAKGKAICVCSKEFDLNEPNELLSSGMIPQKWLHVAFPDEISGEIIKGYVMANLPDGTCLLVPWEEAGKPLNMFKKIDKKKTNTPWGIHIGFITCCRVINDTTLVYDGPCQNSTAIGRIDAGEGVIYPYGILAVEGSRARIFHDVYESVWIDIAELHTECMRLQHHGCSSKFFICLLSLIH